MKFLSLAQLAIVATLSVPGPTTPPAAKFNVVATTPDLASIAAEIGGSAVNVKALAKPTEDPHFVDPKPSHIVTLNRADVLIDGGAELEMGWLPSLLESARNAKLATGSPGRIVASQGIRLVEVPTSFDRSKGDVHSMGNPHFLMDPLNAKVLVAQLVEHFSRVDPSNAEMFAANAARFNAALDAKFAEWKAILAPYKGAKIVTYHKDFVYLAQRFDLDVVATLEPKPGIAPSPAHLAQVISTMKASNVKVILAQSFQSHRTAETVARQTGASVLDASQQPGVAKGTDSYVALMDYLVRALAAGLGGTK
ncbi:MAG: metal ABC transporter substrate-binding protein [Gemmatimonadetes bacterium]|nr:metal ABC transporter substrate-binding protein [Gemmatimonadota bacterium]